MDATISKWNELHEQERFKPKYPSEIVVQYVFQNFPRNKNFKILDMGAGGGRHSFFMAQEGYDVFASDVSETGIDFIKKQSVHLNLKIDAKVQSATMLDYPNNTFDGCLSFGVIYYLLKEEGRKIVNEIHRVLKPGGKALIFVKGMEDHRFGKGQEIEKNTFIYDGENSNQTEGETGMTLHFYSRDELIELMNTFSEVSIDQINQTISNGRFLESNFIVTVKK